MMGLPVGTANVELKAERSGRAGHRKPEVLATYHVRHLTLVSMGC